MRFPLPCPWAFLYGFYFYLLFQAMFVYRFGHLNISFGVLDAFIVLVGILSVLLLFYFLKKLPRGRRWLLAVFFVTVPFAYIGALGGGLLGALGLVVFGMVPFLVTPPLAYWVVARVMRGNASTPEVPAQHDTVERV